MNLTAQNVTNVFLECLFKDDEDTTIQIPVSGVAMKAGFHPERIEANKESIEKLLSQLPNEFKKEIGGGWSFLNACVTSEDVHWGEHRNIDELICLGLAINKVEFTLPRSIWGGLPGGVPYFVTL